jgi:hypothetical protein
MTIQHLYRTLTGSKCGIALSKDAAIVILVVAIEQHGYHPERLLRCSSAGALSEIWVLIITSKDSY